MRATVALALVWFCGAIPSSVCPSRSGCLSELHTVPLLTAMAAFSGHTRKVTRAIAFLMSSLSLDEEELSLVWQDY